MSVGALGIVFGDIGTSPLYAFRETFDHNDIGVDRANVLGVCSLALWSLLLIVTVKYVLVVLRADNRGEGGIMAMTTLVLGSSTTRGRRGRILLLLGLFGMALLYGDGAITPAISVLSATEGLKVVAPSLSDWVVPIAVGILIALFAVQRRGTQSVGRLFGPVMLVWFGTLALLGLSQILANPGVLEAANPAFALDYLASNGAKGLLSMGSIFLVVTGGEALYADLGHFGRRPIQYAWLLAALPALVLNYFGQGALLLDDPSAISSPFFLMGPDWARWPLVALATFATVIASQALITGVFSLTVQAMQLDYLPRLTVRHTSAQHAGQVYLPLANLVLMVACIGLVISFGSSSNLAAAYGLAVTSTMFVTTILLYFLARAAWGWSVMKALALCIPIGLIELAFLTANLFKVPDGGWFPLAVGAVIMVAITTWRTGRAGVADRLAGVRVPIDEFIEAIPSDVARVPGTVVFMYRGDGGTPPALIATTRHHHSVNERVLLVSVITTDTPYVAEPERREVHDLGHGFHRVVLHHGYMEEVDVPRQLDGLSVDGGVVDPATLTYVLGRESVIPSPLHTMALWRERLFALMLRAAAPASRFFRLPPDQVVEVGTQVEI
jgi:KUP system potassium uptake protein